MNYQGKFYTKEICIKSFEKTKFLLDQLNRQLTSEFNSKHGFNLIRRIINKKCDATLTVSLKQQSLKHLL